ncbi:hypothetical protein BJY04DRAFT_179793 [Aspergillus karnatakaensis]|uniref:uncharacterized protein n=1 Tax=Aspergillus karnatakaensis TaxID=1810916 RepID=UPI003CCCEFA5
MLRTTGHVRRIEMSVVFSTRDVVLRLVGCRPSGIFYFVLSIWYFFSSNFGCANDVLRSEAVSSDLKSAAVGRRLLFKLMNLECAWSCDRFAAFACFVSSCLRQESGRRPVQSTPNT